MPNTQNLLYPIVIILVVLTVLYLFPWRDINWGVLSMQPSETITVQGYAETQENNQIATFTAGVSAINNDKQAAVDEVNQKIEEIISQVKAFGIAEADIKTQNISIYQSQEPVSLDGASGSRLGQWNVSNNIEVKLRDASRVSDFSTMLASTGANNVWGPNFTTGDSRETQKTLLPKAVEDAKSKAEEAAKATGRSVGKVLSVTESGASGYMPYAMFDRAMGMGGGGGVPVEPGSSTVSQSVVVTFELK